MKRKDFLKLTALATAGMSISDKLNFATSLEAASLASANRLLINVLLEGGPDFLHLIVPKPSSVTTSYGYKYWNNRTRTTSRETAANNFNSWNNAYTRDYEEFTRNGQTFGILKGDTAANRSYNGWLRAQIAANKVAIIANVKHSTSRDHSNSIMIAQTGVYANSPLQTSVQGWGGQLMNLGTLTGKRLLSMSNPIRQFCNSNGANKAVSFSDSRNFGLTRGSDLGTTEASWDARFRRLRGMQTYLSETSTTLTTSPFGKFTSQYSKLKSLTDDVKNTLNNTSNPQSTVIQNLYARTNGTLKNANFGRQIANLYDALQVPSLNMAIASLSYGGWDSHKNQKTDVELQFDDLFGTDRAFDTLFKQTGGSGVYNNSTLMFYGEFGRQLKDNADGGTDHGTGNYIIVMGGLVAGGVYGTLFPDKDKDNFDFQNRDIAADIQSIEKILGTGNATNKYTDFDPIFSKVGTWLNGGANPGLTLNGGTSIDTSGGITSFASLLP